MSLQQAVLLATLALPGAGGIAAMFARNRAAKIAVSGATLSLVGSIALTLTAASGGAVELVTTGSDGSAQFGISADRMACVLFLLVTAVLAIVQSFAGRYLEGDVRSGRFFALCGATGSMTLLAASAATMTLMAVAWCSAGILLCRMLLHRSELAEAREGAQRTVITFAIGDGAFLLATALVLFTGHDLDLRDPSRLAAGFDARSLDIPGVGALAITPIVAGLLAICAMARSAQLPLHKWLPSTLAAPTPVSAMLHAGLVNGAGLLLITFAPLIALAPAVAWALLAVGLATAIFSTLMSMVRPDVKGSLAWSTSGQMGFMVTQCATGGFAAALFHLIGHGLYKATLFLGSGGAVAAKVRGERVSDGGPALGTLSMAAVSALVPAVALGVSVSLIAPSLLDQRGLPVLLAFAWVSGAQATWSWLSQSGSLGAGSLTIVGGGLALAAVGYVAAIAAFEGFLADSMPAAAAWPSGWIVIGAFVAAIAAFATIRSMASRSASAARLERRAWSIAHDLASPSSKQHGAVAPSRSQRSVPSLQTAPIGASR